MFYVFIYNLFPSVSDFSHFKLGRHELPGLKVPGFWIWQFLRNHIRMPFLPITYGWEPRELAEAPCSRMLVGIEPLGCEASWQPIADVENL